MEQSKQSLISGDTESANSRGAQRNRERGVRVARSCAVATILGAEDTPSPCRIVNISWSGMGIAMKRAGPRDAQVYVQWADGFFVGNNCYMVAKGEEYFLSLQLVTCSYTRL